jgi:predicted nucleic acid-binding protein
MTVRKTIDMLIGTFCAMHAYPLLHADQDFDRMSRLIGLQVVRPH